MATSKKHVMLRVREGARRMTPHARRLLADLRDRGLQHRLSVLVVIDGAKR